jgi:hypothetical protein
VYRKFVPSVARISYNPVVKMAGNAIAGLLSLPFTELRGLPPNHLRIRIGIGNRFLARTYLKIAACCRSDINVE